MIYIYYTVMAFVSKVFYWNMCFYFVKVGISLFLQKAGDFYNICACCFNKCV